MDKGVCDIEDMRHSGNKAAQQIGKGMKWDGMTMGDTGEWGVRFLVLYSHLSFQLSE